MVENSEAEINSLRFSSFSKDICESIWDFQVLEVPCNFKNQTGFETTLYVF